MVRPLFRLQYLLLFFSLATSSFGILNCAEAAMSIQESAIAQTEVATDRNFLQVLFQLNQDYLAVQSQIQAIPQTLDDANRGVISFDTTTFLAIKQRLTRLQQQISRLQTLTSNLSAEQQAAARAELANLQQSSLQLLKFIQPLESGFNPQTIRQIQEFLDFFEAQNIDPGSYGAYGSVTKTEITSFINQNVSQFSVALKALNELATEGAIAPDLMTSVYYLYTTLSINENSATTNDTLRSKVAQFEQENQQLQQRINRLYTLLFWLPLVIVIPTIVLAFILFNYFGRTAQAQNQERSKHQLSMNDINHLENELFGRLQEEYGLTPKVISHDSDVSTGESVALDDPELETPEASASSLEKSISGDKKQDFSVQLASIYDEIVEQYQHNTEAFKAQAIALSISHQESTLDDESEFTPILLLQRDEQGDFWGIQSGFLEYLVPREDLTISTDNYQRFKQIFICYGYKENTLQKAKLLKPARASATEEEDTWELLQQGIVELYSS